MDRRGLAASTVKAGGLRRRLSMPSRSLMATAARHFFLGNYFYAVCVVGLSVDASLKQRLPLSSPIYYAWVAAATVFFYTMPYVARLEPTDERLEWYGRHRPFLFWSMLANLLVVLLSGGWLAYRYGEALLERSAFEWFCLLAFPILAVSYYGRFPGHDADRPLLTGLRQIGWLKPFVIGVVWAGLVTVIPAVFSRMEHGGHFEPDLLHAVLFLRNAMYVSMLAILFDVKDFASDTHHRLMTFVVLAGLYQTIFFVIVPLSAAGMALFVYYGVTHVFHVMRIVLNMVPFALVVLAAWSLRRPRSVMYYFVAIDGLLFVKAGCGIVATVCLE